MNTLQTRFGEVSYDAAQILQFPEGLIGLDRLQRFLVMPNRKEGPLFWMQSVDDPDFAIVVTDPTHFFRDYLLAPDEREREKLGIDADGACHALAIVSIGDSREITLNLSGPILYAPATNRGLQVILDDPRYSTRTPLPTVEAG